MLRRARSRRLLAWSGLFAVFACAPGPKVPEVSPARSLELTDPNRALSAQPFTVAAVNPVGEAELSAEVSVVFNRPMRALELEGTAARAPVQLRTKQGQPVAGEWRWIGTQALSFVPSGEANALPAATDYVLVVPAGTRALDGSVLASERRVEFSTPTPRADIQLEGAGGAMTREPRWSVRLTQRVSLAELQRTLRLLGPQGAASAVQISPHKLAAVPDGHVYLVRPRAPLALDAEYRLEIAAGLRGEEGPRTSEQPQSQTFRTYGPLTVTSVECERLPESRLCDPRGGVQVMFSNPVSARAVEKALRISGVKVPQGRADDEDYEHYSYWVPGPLPAGGRVQVSLAAGAVKDSYGQPLRAAASQSLAVGDHQPTVRLGVQGQVFERNGSPASRTVPLRLLNVPRASLTTAVLDEDAIVEFERLRRGSSEASVAEWLRKRPSAKERTLASQGPKNRAVVETVSLDQVLASSGKKAGVVALATRHEGRRAGEPHEEARALNVTDLALSAKLSNAGGVLWVSRLSTAQPVAGAKVRLRDGEDGKVLFEGTTGADGKLEVPASRVFAHGHAHPLAFVSHEDDLSYRVLDYADNPDRWIDVRSSMGAVGTLITDRDLYQRGETVRVKALVRRERREGLVTPRGERITIEATHYGTGEERTLLKRTLSLGEFGEAMLDVPLPADLPLGQVHLSAYSGQGDTREPIASSSVRLAAYRPAEFRVRAQTERIEYVRGEKMRCAVEGEYLYGAPMSGARARLSVGRTEAAYAPAWLTSQEILGDAAYLADRPEHSSGYSPLDGGGDGVLDARGALHKELALNLPGQTGPEHVFCEATVTDLSRQSHSNEVAALVHPAQLYAVLQPPQDYFVRDGAPLPVTLRTVGVDGKEQRDVAVKLELIRRRWISAYEEQGEGGGRYLSSVKDEVVDGCSVRSGAGQACALQPKGSGYYLVRASASDRLGNRTSSSYGVYVLGNGGGGWAQDASAQVELVANKSSYRLGETAKILIKSPFEQAEALVTVERGGVLSQQRVQVRGGTPTVEVPITAETSPNAFVTVELVRGRVRQDQAELGQSRGVDLGGPAYRLGTVELQVDAEARRLQVQVQPKQRELAPGAQLEAEVWVKDASGKPVESDVTVFVVDEAVLLLSGYKLPDPLAAFSGGLELRVGSFGTRAQLAQLLKFRPGVGEDKGDEGGGGGESGLDDLSAAPIVANLRTDKNGRALLKGSLPDSLTRFRIMAIAAGRDNRFGRGEGDVSTSLPLMVRPQLPRFVRAGDTVQVAALVSRKGKGGAAQVRLTVQGGVLQGPGQQSVQVPDNGQVEVRFPVKLDQVGQAVFGFEVEGLGHKHQSRQAREVQIPTRFETVALAGETQQAVAEQLGAWAQQVRHDSGELQLALSSSALVGLDGVVDPLRSYPFECTEQLSSRLLPLLQAKTYRERYGVEQGKDAAQQAGKLLATVLERQGYDGGFSFWPGSEWSHPWLSAYVTLALSQAEAAGQRVPKAVFQRAVSYLRKVALDVDQSEPHETWSVRALALDALAARAKAGDAEAQRGLAGAIGAMWPAPQGTPLSAQALLVHAALRMGSARSELAAPLSALEGAVRLTTAGAVVIEEQGGLSASARQRLLESDVRTAALVARALLAAQPNHPLAARLIKGLMAGRDGGGAPLTTQEAGWTLLAVEAYRASAEAEAPQFDARLFVGDALLEQARFEPGAPLRQGASVPLAKLLGSAAQPQLTFQVVGSGTLHYEARLRYARRDNPTTPWSAGYTVQRWARQVSMEQLSAGQVALRSDEAVDAGALVLVDLYVVSERPQHQVVVRDPLPAGLEAVDSSLATSSRSLSHALASSGEPEQDAAYGVWQRRASTPRQQIEHNEVRYFIESMPAGLHRLRYLARATSRGQFVVPPARVENMYEPEIAGRTAGSALTVR